jgi:hypothetical protein
MSANFKIDLSCNNFQKKFGIDRFNQILFVPETSPSAASKLPTILGPPVPLADQNKDTENQEEQNARWILDSPEGKCKFALHT